MTLTLQLPLPAAALRSNGSFGKAWTYRDAFRKAKAQAVAEAERVLSDLGIHAPGWERASYVITQFHSSPQRLDPDNLIACCKAYLDAVATAGIIKNDKNLFPERPRFERVARLPRIEISISPIP
jgi:Holliday junction resolvase RusA-like endonuclease